MAVLPLVVGVPVLLEVAPSALEVALLEVAEAPSAGAVVAPLGVAPLEAVAALLAMELQAP